MTNLHIATVPSTALGALGTGILFKCSYSLAPMEGATWGSDETDARNEKTRLKNRRWMAWQRIGIGQPPRGDPVSLLVHGGL